MLLLWKPVLQAEHVIRGPQSCLNPLHLATACHPMYTGLQCKTSFTALENTTCGFVLFWFGFFLWGGLSFLFVCLFFKSALFCLSTLSLETKAWLTGIRRTTSFHNNRGKKHLRHRGQIYLLWFSIETGSSIRFSTCHVLFPRTVQLNSSFGSTVCTLKVAQIIQWALGDEMYVIMCR